MKLIEIWKRLGKQPIKITQHKYAIAIVDGRQYPIERIVYENGIPIGFEVNTDGYVWHDKYDYPETDRDIVVMDKEGKEHKDHRWIGHAYYHFSYDVDGADGWRTDVDIVKWRYDNR